MIFISEKTKTEFFNLIKETDKLYQDRYEQVQNAPTKTDVKNICMMQIDGSLKKFVYKNISNLVTLKFSYCGLRYQNVYVTKPKSLLNGSDPKTYWTLYSALKYQYLANHEFFNNEENKTFALYLYAYKISHNINNSCTHNVGDACNYNPINYDTIKVLVAKVMADVEQGNYDIYDLNGIVHTLKENYTYNLMERFTKDEFIKVIKETGEMPKIDDIVLHVNIEEQNNGTERYVSRNVIKYYVEKYELREMVTMKQRRTKAQMKEQLK